MLLIHSHCQRDKQLKTNYNHYEIVFLVPASLGRGVRISTFLWKAWNKAVILSDFFFSVSLLFKSFCDVGFRNRTQNTAGSLCVGSSEIPVKIYLRPKTNFNLYLFRRNSSWILPNLFQLQAGFCLGLCNSRSRLFLLYLLTWMVIMRTLQLQPSPWFCCLAQSNRVSDMNPQEGMGEWGH